MSVNNEKQLLKNAETQEIFRAREILVKVVNETIAAVEPSSAIRRRLKFEGGSLMVGSQEFDISGVGKIMVVGGGKAGGGMSEALEGILGEKITGGVVNIPKGTASKYRTQKIGLVEAGHPLPTEEGVKGAERMMELVSGLGPMDLTICLLSGGGSSLIALPADGISLDELREATRLLLKSGASIQEINSVRKHLSKIAGGQLAKAASPSRVITLIISDVVGDRLDVIASGPTYPDPTTYSDALAVIESYGLDVEMPPGILRNLKLGKSGNLPETPKPGERCFLNTHHEIIASNADAIKAAEAFGKSLGFTVKVITKAMKGEAREVGAGLAAIARKMAETSNTPALLISGGETTVTVTGDGVGGRNQEITLSAAAVISGLRNVAVASFSTDGVDGPTAAAGAIADGFTVERAKRLGLNPLAHLSRNDSYSFFEKLGDLVMTGITGTNVMDVTCFFLF